MIFNTPFGDAEIIVPTHIGDREVKKVAVKVSGGADSAILLYLTALYVKKENLNFQIIPLTFVNLKKPYQPLFAPNIVKLVQELTDIDMVANHISIDILGEQYSEEQKVEYLRLYENGIFDYCLYGETLNPPMGAFDDFDFGRVLERDEIQTVNQSETSLRPFRHLHKKAIFSLYEQFDRKDLFDLTHSCERTTLDITKLKKHCGKCWFCKERKWGFTDWCDY